MRLRANKIGSNLPALNPKPSRVPYLEGHGNLVSTLLVGVTNLSSPYDPPSKAK